MTWTAQGLEATLQALRGRCGDTTSLEVKRAQGGVPDSLGETLCAMANLPEGGSIILGVDERSRFMVTGLDDVAGMEQAVASLARSDSFSPTPHVEFETVTLEGRDVLIITVRGLSIVDRPAKYRGQAYLRQSDGDYVMNDAELRMIAVAKLHQEEAVIYDERPVPGTSIEDLDEQLLGEYLHNSRASSRRLAMLTDEQLLRNTGVTTADGGLTVAGLYAMGFYPQGKLPLLSVTAAVQLASGQGSGRTRNLRHFDGPLPEMMEEIVGWIQQNAPRTERYGEDGHLREVPDFPPSAVRELVGNALVHRDLGPDSLGVGKGVQIRLTPRGLVIESPGGLRGLSVGQLRSAENAQAAVNQRLYSMVKQLRLRDGQRVIEGEGGGLREVYEAVRRAGLPEPHLINTGVKFRVLLWSLVDAECAGRAVHRGDWAGSESISAATRPEMVVQQAQRSGNSGSSTRHAEPLVVSLGECGPLTLRELVERTGLKEHQVRFALRSLITEGRIHMHGRQGARNTRYTLASSDLV